jgi:hypothetical protein
MQARQKLNHYDPRRKPEIRTITDGSAFDNGVAACDNYNGDSRS